MENSRNSALMFHNMWQSMACPTEATLQVYRYKLGDMKFGEEVPGSFEYYELRILMINVINI